VFNAFEEIFAPGRKHTDDERNRLALTRVDTADGDPGRGPIDLASGKVTVRTQTPRPDADATEGGGAPDHEPRPRQAADATDDDALGPPMEAAEGGGAPDREPPPGQAADATDDDAPRRPGPGRTRDAGGAGDGNGAAARP
jgi:hypothetical protein